MRIAARRSRRSSCCAPSHKGKVTESEIIEWTRQNMAAYKHPRVIEFVDALPKSATGKVQWRVLQEAEMARA